MTSEKLVRCSVSTPPPPAESPRLSARYVPLEIFDLWEYMMRVRHGFEVTDKSTSLWFERGESTESSYSGLEVKRVTRVELYFYSEDDGMLHQKTRYFPSDDEEKYKTIRETFLSHYRENGHSGSKKVNYREHSGVWISR